MAALEALSNHSKTRLKEFFDAGTSELQRQDDSKEALKDLTKNVAEELGVKPAELSKALKLYYKNKVADEQESNEVVNNILAAVL